MENIGLGLTLMLIGMITVFIILLIVINFSKLLIRIVNKVAPEETVQSPKSAPQRPTVDPTVTAIIQAAVNTLTGGKGYAAKIERL